MRRTITGISAAELDDYNPERFDAVLQPDGTYNLVPVLWWDQASYLDYQGDREGLEAE